ncbi:MAG: MTH1187 family thiamine-binding protein [Candidatus Edwardsbacteria bacterium]
MPVAEISVVPVGTASPSISRFVVAAVIVVKQSGLKYELTSMGTNVEGELSEILQLTKKMHQICFKNGAKRVVTTLKIDDRLDKKLTMQGKKQAVWKKMGG